MDKLDATDREKLKESIDNLVKDSPAWEVAWTRTKKVLQKLGKKSGEKMYGFIVDVASEAMKKKLGDCIP